MARTPDPGHDPLGRLDKRLEAFDAQRQKPPRDGMLSGAGSGASEAYGLIGQMLGGVFGGVGLGWLLDHFAHTGPWGLVGGLLIGMTISIVATIQTARRMGRRSPPDSAPPPTADEDDD
jgi:ATP synthase protein I